MGKWLAAGSLALVALLVLLWYEIHSPIDAAAAAPAKAEPVAPAPAPPPPTGLAKAAQQVAQAETKSEKMTTDSDEFFYAFQDVITQVATRNAMGCYTGGIRSLDRNAKVKFEMKDVIKNGVVSLADIKVVESTINDPELIECFKRELAKTTMQNARFPDYAQPDMVLIRPGRNVNKFGKEAMEYQGSGPDFTKEHPLASPH
jgi:hypothetical protein